MHARSILVLMALLLSWPMLAFGALDAVEESYEADLTQVTLPAHSASQVVIRECNGCDPIVLPVNGNTTYSVDGQAADLDTLRTAAESESRSLVVVHYALESGVVTRIVLP